MSNRLLQFMIGYAIIFIITILLVVGIEVTRGMIELPELSVATMPGPYATDDVPMEVYNVSSKRTLQYTTLSYTDVALIFTAQAETTPLAKIVASDNTYAVPALVDVQRVIGQLSSRIRTSTQQGWDCDNASNELNALVEKRMKGRLGPYELAGGIEYHSTPVSHSFYWFLATDEAGEIQVYFIQPGLAKPFTAQSEVGLLIHDASWFVLY